ncbi:MAG: hypothetical protein CMJ59_03410 [Planctomycetaceae bacterium]|nr:hypothetical protein [Planctomycetaceae bacterium]
MHHKLWRRRITDNVLCDWLLVFLAALGAVGWESGAGWLPAEEPPRPEPSPRFAIALHGGAGQAPDRLSRDERAAYRTSLSAALRRGRDWLAAGKSSVEVVEHVVRLLEDDPRFNAGKGAVFNSVGSCELDASIMDGRDLSGGAVAGVTRVKNPISLARLVMQRTRHVLLAGDGADQFAIRMGVDRVDPSYFATPRAQRRFERIRRERERRNNDNRGGQPPDGRRSAAPDDGAFHGERYLGTVGCVALDQQGNLAAATSTGGLSNKQYGRIGDSPILGAGTYAANATCAVSCTGIGEQFIRHAIAYSISARMRLLGEDVQTAVRQAIHDTLQPGDGGVIAVDHRGHIAIDFSTPGMARGWADADGTWEIRLGGAAEKAKQPRD